MMSVKTEISFFILSKLPSSRGIHRPSRDLCPLFPAPARLQLAETAAPQRPFCRGASGSLPFSARAAGSQIKEQL